MKVLLFDIETSYYVHTSWTKWTPGMEVVKEKSIISIQYKWLGEKKVHTISLGDFPKAFKKDPWNDKYVIKAFLPIIEEADLIVAHNGDKFDMRFLRGRCLLHDYVLPKTKTFDTLKACRKYFYLHSNRLGDIAKYLGLPNKGKTEMSWWHKILWESDEKALDKLVKYGAQDIVVLEAIYKKLLPHLTGGHPHMALLMGKEIDGLSCPSCASTSYRKHNKYYTDKKVYQRYMCKKCNATFTNKKSIDSV